MGTMGNTFDVNTVKYGHARKVWREIRHRYPGGGMVSNISDWLRWQDSCRYSCEV